MSCPSFAISQLAAQRLRTEGYTDTKE